MGQSTDNSTAVAKSVGSLTMHMEDRVRPLVDLIDGLRELGIEKDIAIPQIAVMGDQSSGKSSVLEAISGINFPRGAGLVTKCATELRMKRARTSKDVWRARISLSWDKPQPKAAGEVGTKEEIGERIAELTTCLIQARGGNATFEPEHSILVELEGNDLPDLTLIDLPGIVRTAVNGQDATVIEEVDGLISRYLQQDRTVILPVIPSNVDIATVDIIERASKADPQGKRTVGVLTKADMIGDGAYKPVLATLRNLTKPLKLGYTMVKNRSQKEIESNMSVEEAKESETRFFRDHEEFKHVLRSNPELFGVQNLTAKLTNILLNRIEEALPPMASEVNALIKKTKLELEGLGRPIPNDHEGKCIEFLRVVEAIASDLNKCLAGNYTSPIFDQNKHLRIIARIKSEIESPFAQKVGTSKPEWDESEVVQQISETRGRELPGFPNFEAFTYFVRSYVKEWREPMMEVLDGKVGIVQQGAQGLIQHHASFSSPLIDKLTEIICNVIGSRSEASYSAELDKLIENEMVPSTQNHYFLDTYNKAQSSDFQAYLKATFTSGNYTADSVRSAMMSWFNTSKGIGDSNTAQEAKNMIDLLDAYWKTSMKRFVDNVCQVTDRNIVQGLADDFMSECFKLSMSSDITDLLQEDSKVQDERKELQSKLDRLLSAHKMLQKVQ